MAEQDWMGAREYLQQAVVIVEKFESPGSGLASPCYGVAVLTGTQRKTNQLKQVVGAPKPHPQDCEFFRKGRAAARVILSAPPIARVLGASANKRAVS